ncbi:MAG: hypothetical protein GKR93_16450 [Gammaproteobacteria bacterium]|nr:hypothetical protein [Gammaproteobacteria bacterium]
MLHYYTTQIRTGRHAFLCIRTAGDYEQLTGNALLKKLNGECLTHGFEAILIDLEKVKGLDSINDIWKALNSPEKVNFLPIRIGFVNGSELWDENWERLEIALLGRGLNWRNFTDFESAEHWLMLDRQEALAS